MWRPFAGFPVSSAFLLVVLACGKPAPGTKADADAGSISQALCPDFTATVCPSPKPVYADVSPIFDARCNTCHASTTSGPWPLNSYSNIMNWSDLVEGDVKGCSMPPTGSNTGFTAAERTKLLTWFLCGAPQQ